MGTTSHRPLVSVVLPARDAGTYLPLAVRSILQQTLTDLELVVIDDGSTDGTQAFLAAVSAQDSVALSRLVLSRAEFAWLYYPAHIYARPPYELDPLTSWMLQQGNSSKGFSRVLREYGGQRLGYVTHGCKPAATVEPPVREWNQCEVGLKVGEYETVKRLFGSIVEIGGQYKFVSYANDL